MAMPRLAPQRSNWKLLATAISVIAVLAGCSLEDALDTGDPTNPAISGSTIEGPSAAQIAMDLPATLATPPADALRATEPAGPCADEPWPGPGFACLTRYIIGQIALPLSAIMQDAVSRTIVPLSQLPIPADFTASMVDDGILLEVSWTEVEGGRTFSLDFFTETGEAQLASWEWTLFDDGAAMGRLDMIGQFLALEGDEDVASGVSFQFASDATGTEKQMVLDIDFGDAPPAEDMSAPTSLHLVADRSATGWVVSYAMYHPSWLYDDVAQQGVETYLLVSAMSGLTALEPAAMSVIALPGLMSLVPPTPDEEWSVCSYIWGVQMAGGMNPEFSCEDNNPFYLLPDGSVQEGGMVPDGFDSVDAALGAVGYATENLDTIRDLTIDFN